jgi:hypothetical protein
MPLGVCEAMELSFWFLYPWDFEVFRGNISFAEG